MGSVPIWTSGFDHPYGKSEISEKTPTLAAAQGQTDCPTRYFA
jgi:hypothetical protein